MKRIHLFLSGRVQGVFFRASTKKTADRIGITGFVRNLADGRVEIIAEGDEQALQRFLQWCNQGPRGAHVENISLSTSSYQNEFDNFEIR